MLIMYPNCDSHDTFFDNVDGFPKKIKPNQQNGIPLFESTVFKVLNI